MITFLNAKDFAGVSWLETSQLMQNHPEGIKFSTDKPNVIVGPNGAGKSALLTALSLHTLTYYTDESNFDVHYINGGRESDCLWTKRTRWRDGYVFLQGLEIESDLAPSMYYRPNRIPGNENMIASSMMMGYFDQAHEYGTLTRDKSSGQKSRAVMDRLLKVLRGEERPQYTEHNWKRGRVKRKIDERYYTGEQDYLANSFIEAYEKADGSGVPLVLMDEPEQSLDALAELQLWRAIENAKTQVIVATHSIYPFLRPEKFNIIEGQQGYCATVQSTIKDVIGPLKQ